MADPAAETLDLAVSDEISDNARDGAKKMRMLGDAVPQLIWRNEADGRATYFNKRWYEFTGLTYEESEGAGWEAVVHPDDAAAAIDRWERALAAGQIFDVEYRLRQADGEYRWFTARHVPVRDENGKVTSWFGTATDIHDLKSAQTARAEAEERFRLLVEGARDYAMFLLDLDNRISYWSSGAERLFGWSRHEAEGKSGDLILTDEDKANGAVERELATAMCDGRASNHRWHKRKDGSRLWVDGVLTRVDDNNGNPRGFAKIARDSTEQKQAHDALAEAAQEQQALAELVQRQYAAVSLREIYTSSLDAICATLHCDRASILLFDRRNVMRFVAARGLSGTYRNAVEGHSPWQPDTKDPQPITIPDVDLAELPRALKIAIKAEGIRASAFIPLLAKGKVIGKFMAYYNEPHVFSNKEMSLALNIARQLTLGLGRRLAEEELHKSKLLLEQRVQRRTEALRAANRELEREIERRKGLEGEILEVSDREQQRLGQELHDGLCQQLTAIGFMARATATRLKDHRVVHVEDLEKIAQLITNSVSDARNLARDLHKEEVDAAGFVEALRGLTQREMWKSRCELQMKTEVHVNDDRTASQLYRILREALINAHKHALASKVILEVRRVKNNLVFSVTDNGVGFSRKAKSGKGLGFHIMQYRASSIGAKLRLESPAKGGARVVCYLPQANGSN